MPPVKNDYVLNDDQRAWPLVWIVDEVDLPLQVDTSDEMLERAFGPGTSRKLKSWGHSGPVGVHWLATRSGTVLHTDPAYARYTHHLILRNDGFRLIGMEDREVQPLIQGTMYCLDTHSPHQVVADPRLSGLRRGKPVYKLQAAFDTDDPWQPDAALEVLLGKLADDPNEGADAAAKTAAAPKSGARP